VCLIPAQSSWWSARAGRRPRRGKGRVPLRRDGHGDRLRWLCDCRQRHLEAAAFGVDLRPRLRGALPRNLLPAPKANAERVSRQQAPKAVVVTMGVRHGSPTAVAHGPLLTGRHPPAHPSHDNPGRPMGWLSASAGRGLVLARRRRPSYPQTRLHKTPRTTWPPRRSPLKHTRWCLAPGDRAGRGVMTRWVSAGATPSGQDASPFVPGALR
jgi:hypothetical protein